jgi:YVTN family beta-propeller protein
LSLVAFLAAALASSCDEGLLEVTPAAGPLARASDGPGLGNRTYAASDQWKPISVIKSPDGHGNVFMHRGYLAVVFAQDSGLPGGGFEFWDVSDPRTPRMVFRKQDASTFPITEPHGFGVHGDLVALQTVRGVQIWNWANPFAPALVSDLTLPDIQSSAYDLGNWWTFWQAPYIYVAGSANGLYVVDATDPARPQLVKRLPTGQTGGFRLNQVFAIGNLLVGAASGAGFSTFDISDPRNPVLLASTTSGPDSYSHLVNGDRIYSGGLEVTDISDPRRFVRAAAVGLQGGIGYLTYQDGHIHGGYSTRYAKFDVRDLGRITLVGTASTNIPGRDEDFGTALGNLAFIGNDHGQGSALVVHQTAPDTTGPVVTMVSPRSGASDQRLTTRVGLTFSDHVDLRALHSGTFIVRPVGGAALPGRYSQQLGVVNFAPQMPLAPNTTYEVVVPAGGVRDWVGNPTPVTFTSRFTTAPATGISGCDVGVDTPRFVDAEVAFSATGCMGTGALSYSWSFGDGSAPTPFSSNPAATRRYARPGHHTVALTVRDAAGQRTFARRQTVVFPPTSTRPTRSTPIVYDAPRAQVLVVNPDADTVTAIDGNTHAKKWEVPVGRHPRTLAVAGGAIWVACQDDATIRLIDAASGAGRGVVFLPPGSRPYGVAFDPAGAAAYVTLEGTGRLLRVDPATRTVTGALDVGPRPRGLAVSADGGRVLVTRFVSGASAGEVREVSPNPLRVVRTYSLAADVGPDTEASGRGVPNYLQAVTISPDGRSARVPSKKDNTARGTLRDEQPLTFESTVRTVVSRLDLVANTEQTGARRDLNDADLANAVVFNDLGDYLFVATHNRQVAIFDALDDTGVALIHLGPEALAPQGLALGADGRRLYVHNFMSRSVDVYDVTQVGKSNAFPKLASVRTVAAEPLSARVLRGKQIFYDSGDRRMSRDSYIACASCHLEGGSDERVWDFTDRGEGLRNTISLLGRRGMGHGRVHATANFDEIQDFENDIRGGFGGTGFLTDAQFSTGTRRHPLGDPKAGLSAELDALAAYVNSLATVGRSPHRLADGTLTPSARAGKALYQSLACGGCHGGPDFTNSAGGALFDVGTIRPSSGKRLGQPLTGLDTPTLLGLWSSAPYFHDGSAATLLDVLDRDTGGRHGSTRGLSAAQKQQLTDYLLQIDELEREIPVLAVIAADRENAADYGLQANLRAGDLSHGDRTHTWANVPSTLAGALWLRTANDSKRFAGEPTITLELGARAEISVAWDVREPPGAWLAGWSDTQTTLVQRDGTDGRLYPMRVYRRTFSAGAVRLGPCASPSGGVNMYAVIVRPAP